MKYFALITVMLCLSCQKEESKEDSPKTLIIGKWEHVLDSTVYRYEDKIEEEVTVPTGYLEFLPKGRFAWYDYGLNIYSLFYGKYWLEERDSDWTVFYHNCFEEIREKIELKDPIAYYLVGGYYSISFSNKNRMILRHPFSGSSGIEVYYIYQRIK